jgi:hypothetical protein
MDVVARVCHPSHVGSIKQEDHSAGPLEEKARPYLQNNQSQKGWKKCSGRSMPA